MKLSEVKKMSLTKIHSKINDLEGKIKELEDDRNEYRNFIKREIQLHLQVMVENKYYAPKACVERLTAFLANAKPFRIWW